MGVASLLNVLMNNFTILLITLLATLVGVWLFKRRFIKQQFFKRYGIDGPKPDLWFGNYLQLKHDRINKFSEWIKLYGDHFGYYNGADPVIVSSDLDTVRDILIKDSLVFRDRLKSSLNEEPFKSSILYLNFDRWKAVRTTLTPAFSAAKMRLMQDIMHDCSTIFTDIVEEKAKTGETFDISSLCKGLTLDITARCALAMNSDCQRKPEGLRKNVEEFMEGAENVIVDFAFALPILEHLLGFLYRTFGTGGIVKAILDNLNHVIKLRRAGQVPVQMDLLQLMLDAQQKSGKITDNELIANAFIMLVAGYETSSTALTFMSHILAEKPELQEEIVAEVKRHFPGKTELSYDDLNSLKFLQSFIDESLRLYTPVVLFVSRNCTQDITINGRFFPKGVNVMIPVQHIHHSPEYWDDPEEFRPERFAADADRPLHPAQFLPFGAGPRVCIGMRFALLEIKMSLIKLLLKVRLEPGDGFVSPPKLHVPSVITNPKHGIFVKAKLVTVD